MSEPPAVEATTASLILCLVDFAGRRAGSRVLFKHERRQSIVLDELWSEGGLGRSSFGYGWSWRRSTKRGGSRESERPRRLETSPQNPLNTRCVSRFSACVICVSKSVRLSHMRSNTPIQTKMRRTCVSKEKASETPHAGLFTARKLRRTQQTIHESTATQPARAQKLIRRTRA